MGSGSEQRQRQHQVNVRLTDEERQILAGYADAHGFSSAEALRDHFFRPVVRSKEPPSAGHTFRFYVTSRGSYTVSGEEIYRDAGYWSPLRNVVEVRAFNLKDAIAKLSELPLGVWLAPRCWCGGEVGDREPGDAEGLGCLANINHDWQGA